MPAAACRVPDTQSSYERLADGFGRANFVSSLWSMAGAKQLLQWVAPSLPPPGLCMVEQPYERRLGEGAKVLSVALMMLESREQPTLTPEHTDATPSVLCMITGRKVITLREASIASGQLEPRQQVVELNVGDVLYIPAGVHHEVISAPNTIAFSIGIKTPSDLSGPTVWRGASLSWRTPLAWRDSVRLWSDSAMKEAAFELSYSYFGKVPGGPVLPW